uniref:Mce/MlaD domain-containing protein n=1 Tax=Synarthrophyton chejuense TaxID=2485825 RepID=A0A3G3MFL8_9FLOR|nr:hypothetical protein [Synarthrophyton chejuense]AYR05617.1 hypothetical protein [Synarthrophyton chejuense]
MKKAGIIDYFNILKTSLVFWLFMITFIVFTIYSNTKNTSYSFFIEFDNANGVNRGTPIRIRGIQIGSIQSIKIKPTCVLTLAKINSDNIFIPKDSIIEISQTGLLNDSVIDIIPLDLLNSLDKPSINLFTSKCKNSNLICNNMYITGDRGLNYDDLVRSTTRISQRFDDPRFFNLFYVFLQNGIEVTDVILELMIEVLSITSTGHIYLQKFLANDLF